MAIIGAGSAIIYISVYAAYYFYSLIGVEEAFVFLLIECVSVSYLAYATSSQGLYLFSLVGAYLVPVLTSSGENSYRFLFSYLLLLNFLFLLVSRRHPWKISAFFIALADFIVYFSWASGNISESDFYFPFAFITAVMALFTVREFIVAFKLRKTLNVSSVVLLLLMQVVFTFAGMALVKHHFPTLSSLFLLMVAALAFCWSYLFQRTGYVAQPPEKKTAALSFSIAGLLFLYFAQLNFFDDEMWLCLSVILMALTLIFIVQKNYSTPGTWYGLGALFLVFGHLISGIHRSSFSIPVLNAHFALFILGAGTMVYMYLSLRRLTKLVSPVSYVAFFVVILAALIEVNFSVHSKNYRTLGYSYVLAFFGVVSLLPGFVFRLKTLRFSGLALLLMVIVKFYLYDIWVLNTIVRIIAGLTLGVGLVVVSLFYQKLKSKIFEDVS